MRKSIKFRTLIALVTALVFISACKKDEVPEGSNYTTKLSGLVKAELDLTNATTEFAPIGTRITFLINPNDLQMNPDTAANYDSYRYTTTVLAEGKYTIELPAKNVGSMVKIVMDDFEYQTVYVGGTTQRKIYKGDPTETTIYAGTAKIMDLFYQ
ncbi:MAG: hypothetical protein H0V01_15210 [Bacteroidetes bacterium]|nr:hypothetical protein [Bacteroidota bacterium]HET6245917.1 hypothetical protein [Bacteroidia bacterium]